MKLANINQISVEKLETDVGKVDVQKNITDQAIQEFDIGNIFEGKSKLEKRSES